MRRAVILAILALLLFAIAGATIAREGVFENEPGGETTASETTVPEIEPRDEETTAAPELTEPEEAPSTRERTSEKPPAVENAAEKSASESERGAAVGRRSNKDKDRISDGREDGKKPALEAEKGGGKGGAKVTLCHKGKNEISVGKPAERAHLRHGDVRGACGSGAPPRGLAPGKR